MRLLLLATFLTSTVALADDGNWSASGGGGGISQAAGDARYQLLSPADRNTITADDFFSEANDGVCFEDTDQCLTGDAAGGYAWRDETGTVTATLTTAGLLTVIGGFLSSGVTTDFTCATGEDCRVVSTTTGSIQLQPGDLAIDLLDSTTTRAQVLITSGATDAASFRSNTSTGGAVKVLGSGAFLGNRSAVAATTRSACLAENLDAASPTCFLGAYGSGAIRIEGEQNAACAAGVVSLDPSVSIVNLDGNAAACVVTLQETTAATIGPGFEVTINVFNAAAVAVTFPDAANVSNVPTLCSTTGLNTDGVLRIVYTNRTDDLWLGESCVQN